MKKQDTFGRNELYARGYTIRQAAASIGRSYGQVAAVLRGERRSAIVITMLRALPQRALQFRRRSAELEATTADR